VGGVTKGALSATLLRVPTLVAPFFRASAPIGPRERALFAGDLSASAFESGLRASDAIVRQNLRRLFGAALLADVMGGRLVFVEGWRSNAVSGGRGRTRVVTGSWWFAVFLTLLRRRGLVPPGPPPLRRDISRCTWEEARGVLELAEGAPVIGVSDVPCPSAARASRYLRGGIVYTPAGALNRAVRSITSAQRSFWKAVQPGRVESLLAPLVEAPNWVLHGVSEVSAVVGLDPPLEVRLARALRPDAR
jgi:hypothetical protein